MKKVSLSDIVGKTVKKLVDNYCEDRFIIFTDDTYCYLKAGYEYGSLALIEDHGELSLCEKVSIGMITQKEADVIEAKKKKDYEGRIRETELDMLARLKRKYENG